MSRATAGDVKAATLVQHSVSHTCEALGPTLGDELELGDELGELLRRARS
jgi:hypothetical protein